MVRITTGKEYGPVKDDYIQKRTVLGYYATKQEALTALADFQKNPYSITDVNVTVKELWDTIKDTVKASDDRKKVYARTFDKYMTPISGMKVRQIRARHLQQIIDDCKAGYSVKSNIRSVMHHMFRYAAQNDIIDKDYTDYIKFEQEQTILQREIYTDEEVKKLWAYSDQEEYAFTLVLLHQGMRIKEFMELSPEDIDLEAGTISIRKAKNNYSIRTIPINKAVFDLVRRFKEHPTTLTKSRYEHFTNNALGHRAYDVRHTFATKCNTLGLPTLIVQRIMGHKPDTLLEQVYTHLSIEELSEAICKVTY
jgi:integrase